MERDTDDEKPRTQKDDRESEPAGGFEGRVDRVIFDTGERRIITV